MFKIDINKRIHLTRGDVACMRIKSYKEDGKTLYTFNLDDVVRLKVMEAGKCENVVLTKDVTATEVGESVRMFLSKDETKIGPVISKPDRYWYEVELNPDTDPRSIICYDEKGPKLFILYPEGGDKK